MEYRATASPGEGMEFVLSDGSMDRHGTRLNPNGWDLANFRKNPIALFGHSSAAPIGTWANVRVVKDRLVGKLVMAAEGTSARIDELRKLVEQGILRAVSVGFSVLKTGTAGKSDFDFDEMELMEVSLVSVPSNTNAINTARALKISESTIRMAFGEHAELGQRAVSPGKNAARPSLIKGNKQVTLSQRIEQMQTNLNSKRDLLSELTSSETVDTDAIEALNGEVETAERTIAALKVSEARIGINATKPAAPESPAVLRRPLGFPQREVKGVDLIVRAMLVKGVSHFTNKPVEKVLDERYPGHEATAIMCRADQTIGTTTGSHWADDIVQVAYADFVGALQGLSIYPALRSRGIALSTAGVGTVSIPGRTAGTAGGGFAAEGAPIRVGKLTTTSVVLTPKKMGVIVAFSRELAKHSTPVIEALVRQSILEDTSAILDPIILDATAVSSSRPAGLLNGVSAAASGYGGGDFVAVQNDFKALLAPFYTANAGDNLTVIMNPAQGFAMSMMTGPVGDPSWLTRIKDRVTIIESTHATANRLIAIRNSDFATALGDAPEFDVSEQATIHMEDTTPLEIVAGTPTVADPVRSLWQTATIGVRMLMDVTWRMRRSGMVQWIDTTTW